MIALEQLQFLGVKRLASQAQPIHAAFGKHGQTFRIEIARVGLDGPFVTLRERMPMKSQFTQSLERIGRKIRGGPTPEIERVDFTRLAKPTQFPGQRGEQRFNQIIPPRHDREVTVAATMHAKGNVNIRGTRWGKFLHEIAGWQRRPGPGERGSPAKGRIICTRKLNGQTNLFAPYSFRKNPVARASRSSKAKSLA